MDEFREDNEMKNLRIDDDNGRESIKSSSLLEVTGEVWSVELGRGEEKNGSGVLTYMSLLL